MANYTNTCIVYQETVSSNITGFRHKYETPYILSTKVFKYCKYLWKCYQFMDDSGYNIK